MIRGASLRWRLVGWVTGVLIVVLVATFAVVYEETGSQLRTQVAEDVRGDLAQLTATVRSLGPDGVPRLASRLRAYIAAQPFTASASLLYARVPGHGTVSNHPELFGDDRADDGESAAEQAQENLEGQALLRRPTGTGTTVAPDVGPIRLAVRTLAIDGTQVRLGAAEPLSIVTRAQHGVARAFLAAGVLALALVLAASYLAGAVVSRPLRRLTQVAEGIDEGDLAPRIEIPATASREIRVLAGSLNRMLDRLADSIMQQRDFVADASHELRTPLTVIGGQLEVLAADPDASAQDIARVEQIVAAEVRRTSRLVDDLLLLARAEQPDFLRHEPLSLRAWTEDLWRTTTAAHERRFALGPVPDVPLRADPDRLAQALRNLIANAVAHTREPGGRVALEVSRGPGTVCFAVSDDGPGIPADERERVFERFHRTDRGRSREAGGAGLGLAIVDAIAVAHGGSARAVAPSSATGARLELVIPTGI